MHDDANRMPPFLPPGFLAPGLFCTRCGARRPTLKRVEVSGFLDVTSGRVQVHVLQLCESCKGSFDAEVAKR